MNTEKIAALTLLLGLSGLNARAQQINWNGNPLQQFQAALAEQKAVTVPQARLVALKNAPAAGSVANLKGKALGSTVLVNDGSAYNDKVALRINNDGDRVGARFENCPSYEGSDDFPHSVCQTVDFAFPQLTVDAKAKVIKFGDQIVARWKGIFGLGRYSPTNGWRLVITKNHQTGDDGFKRSIVTHVAVALVK